MLEFMGDSTKKNIVWCDVCGFKKAYEKAEEALIISKAHKNGQHQLM